MPLRKLSDINNKDCIVVIPVYKNTLKVEEKISLFQCIKILGKSYEICLVYPDSMNVEYYQNISNGFHFNLMACNDEYFKSTATYSLLCENPEFYRCFQEYKFMLIYQLDGWIFENNLEYFLKQDYDYNGSPWETGSYGFRHKQVGNGGVSLRRISKFIELCESLNKYDLESKYAPSEDVFFCKYLKAIKRNIPFSIAPATEGAKFSFTTCPGEFYRFNGYKLPMCAHGWNMGYDFDLFWHKYIPYNEYKDIQDLDYNFYTTKVRNNNNVEDNAKKDNEKNEKDNIQNNIVKAEDPIIEQEEQTVNTYNSMLYEYMYGSNNKQTNQNAYDNYFGLGTKTQTINYTVTSNAAMPYKYINEFEYNKYDISKNSQILICIFNYKHDDNAKKLLYALQKHFETVVLDSGNDHEEKDFIQFPNIYYSGLWNEMKKLSEQKDYKYVCQICSDVEIDNDNMLLLISRLYNLLLTDKIGVWQPGVTANSRKNWTAYKQNSHYTIPSVIEGWMSVISNEILKNINYVDTNINLYGYGIDIVISVMAKNMNKLLVIDNTVEVYNPADTGYDNKIANAQGNAYLKKILNKRLSDFSGHYTFKLVEHIDDLDTDITFVVPFRGRENMMQHFEKNIQKMFSKYTYKILYINQCDSLLFRPGQLRNIGAKFANSKYIIIQDVDILHLHQIDINKIYQTYRHPLRLFDSVSQLTIDEKEEYHITLTEKREGTSGCMLFTYEDWMKFNGFSNIFRGWGSEDDTFRYYSNIKTYKQNIGHITHPKNNNINKAVTDKNRNIYFNSILKNKIKHELDGWRQELFNVADVIKKSNDIFTICIDNISTLQNYQYANIYSEYDTLENKNKNVIYTCISGNYDQLLPIKNKQEGWDYICFTDQNNITSDTWQIRPIPSELSKYSQVKRQRMIKILCHKYLHEYTNVIWIDANISINENTNLNDFIKNINKNANMSFKLHPQRNCIYNELTACVRYKKETKQMTDTLNKRYKAEKFPEKFGLYETNVIYRNNDSEIMKQLMYKWAYEVKENSHRDQLSLNYCIWLIGCKNEVEEFDANLFLKYFTQHRHKAYN